MVDIQSKEVIDKIAEELKIQPSMQIPRELAKLIQLVYNVNPERNIKTATGSVSDSSVLTTIFTASIKKDTFLIGLSLGLSKDVLSDAVLTQVRGKPFAANGAVQDLLDIRYEPLTAEQFNKNINFSIPIKLLRGSLITLQHDSGTPSIDGILTIYYYEVDPL